jgi:CheY-like chemotaxis protein
VLRDVRRDFAGRIVMLTARDDDIDQVLGLEGGADDYIAKPVAPRVPEALREAVFEPFKRLDGERERRGAGYGLGLAIVRRVAQAPVARPAWKAPRWAGHGCGSRGRLTSPEPCARW